MFGIPTFDLLTDTGKQEFIQYIINLMRNEIISFTSSYNTPTLQNVISSEHLIGTNTLRPEAHSVPIGTYYTSTDVSGGTTYRSDGVQWVQIAGGVQVGSLGYYGSFYDTTTQSIATANTAKAITFNTTAESNGVSIGTPTSRIVLTNKGTYNIQFSAQLDQSSANSKHVWLWLRVNGSDVSQTNSLVTIAGSSAEEIISWNYFYTSTTSNEYVELIWAVEDTGTTLTSYSSPTVGPAIPSVILTVQQVMNTQVGPTGPTGPANTLSIGTVTTGTAGSNASATITGTAPSQTLNLTIPRGDTGLAATVSAGTTTTGLAGTNATVVNSGTSNAAIFDFTIPRGNTGATGAAATINAGTTTTNAAGTNATVVNGGTSSAAVFNFGIPGSPTVNVGTTTTGAAGSNATVTSGTGSTQYAQILDFTVPGSPTINAGTTTTNAAGTNASVTASGTQYARIFDFGIPGSPTVNAGTTTTNAAGTSASVTATGTQYARVFNFGIPGNPNVTVGTTTTGAPGTNATVVNSGTSNAITLDFTIPRGNTGAAGIGNPSGAIIPFGGTSLPTGYLWCDGTQQLKATYPDLYAALGANRYGTDTATQFFLPDLRSRFPRGTATTGGTVTTNNINTHTHTLNAFNASSSFTGTATNTGNSDPSGHSHGVNAGGTNNDGGGNTGVNNANAGRANGTLNVAASGHIHGTPNHNHGLNGANTGNANTLSHGHSVTATGTVATTITAGTNATQDHLPAYVEVNYIIKT